MDSKKWQAWGPWKIPENGEVDQAGKGVFSREHEVIHKWRLIRDDKNPDNETYQEPKDFVGIAFSGGGIRSATFGLGVLEALKEKNLLKKIDYLSTVSGGGYIGSWLSANCKRTEERRQENRAKKQPLDPSWVSSEADWTQSITHLRRFSNYLSPRLSFFSVDTWSMLTVWLRNTLLIQLTIFFAIAFLLLLPRILFIEFNNVAWLNWNAEIASMFFSISVVFIVINLKNMNPEWADCLPWLPQKNSAPLYVKICACMLLAASFCFAILLWFHSVTSNSQIKSLVSGLRYFLTNQRPFILLALVSFALFSFFSSNRKEQNIWKKGILIAGVSLTTTAILTLLLSGILIVLKGWADPDTYDANIGKCLAYVWTPTMVISSLSIAVIVFIGMQGRAMNEYLREWWSRFGAALAIIGFSWMVMVIVAIYGPLWSFWLYFEGPWKSISSGWLLTTLAGLLAGKSADTGNGKQQEVKTKIKEIGAKFAPFVFIAGLLVSVSTLLHLVVAFNSVDSTKPGSKFEISRDMLLVDDSKHKTNDWNIKIDKHIWSLLNNKSSDSDVQLAFSSYQPEQTGYNYPAHWRLLNNADKNVVYFSCLICLVCLYVLGKRVDINEFSLNAFYRNRLTRCYLGATKRPEERKIHPFTGFDPDDDLSLCSLVNENKEPYGPLHIINCALNLGGSSDLLLHTRHSNIFTLSPLFCGSPYKMKNANSTVISEIGFVETETYTGQGQLTLGQAMAVSGAAASPNMGYHTSTPVSFLMTLFNARLGWWFPHPWYSNCTETSPASSLTYLLYELFGLANEKNEFLNISDGGHFENMGAYELVKRKCNVIIISDGECDPKMQLEGLSNLIRLCDVDRLAKIEIDVSAVKSDDKSGWSNSCCAVGKIKYSAFPAENSQVPDGWLIYIKAAMTGHEDTAIMQYKATHPDFPHETTGDQFYTEDQFESYRHLGKNITSELFGKWDKKAENISKITLNKATSLSEMSMEEVAHHLSHILSPELVHQTQSIVHAERLIDIWKQLGENEKLIENFDMNMDLSRLRDSKELVVEVKESSKPVFRPIFYFCNEIIQLMENVYLDLNLEETWDRDDNKGWMELFRLWAGSPQVIQTWELTRHTYGIKFISFWDRKLTSQG